MGNKVVKRIGLGIAAYMLFVVLVMLFYKGDPNQMEWQDREQYNRVQISKLEAGMSKQQIIDMMGSPDISEAKSVTDKVVQVMFYRTERKKSDGITTADECIPLLFEDNQLIAWGKDTYQQYLDL
ncbi:DUF3192 domain-containing protein [Neptunicella marina]|uniref:DUF3192 domain-containing protein n=1 Tax=Neptunicella marina TaxID=2125989 RepID=A0A8J6IPX6_9ALTE|nr:DUF3192 domain-containing protein [Neptunicella marina]MBC3764911.1 DUF3192 domain-containing protein [Neptunicella marina]